MRTLSTHPATCLCTDCLQHGFAIYDTAAPRPLTLAARVAGPFLLLSYAFQHVARRAFATRYGISPALALAVGLVLAAVCYHYAPAFPQHTSTRRTVPTYCVSLPATRDMPTAGRVCGTDPRILDLYPRGYLH